MALQGIFASHQGIVGERVGDFASAILQLYPTGNAPLLALSSGMSKESAQDTVFTWYEDTHISGRTDIVSGGTTTTLVVADGSFYVAGTMLLVEETGEYLLVLAAAGNSLTVQRGLGGSAIVSVNNTMHVQQVGNAREEGSGMPTPVNQQGAPKLNFVQIFRNAWAITGTAQAVKFTTGSKLAKNKSECAMYHAEDQERAMWWGIKHVGVVNGKQFRTTEGIVRQIENGGGIVETANSGAIGSLSMIDFNDFIRRVFAKNVKGQPNERITFCGDIVLQVLNNMATLDSSYRIMQGESKYGIVVTTVMTPFGTLKLLTHPLMNENPLWQKELYVLHPGAIRRRVLRETFEDNYDSDGRRIAGIDAAQGAMTTEAGIEVGAARVMGIYRNIANAVSSLA